MTPRIIQKYQYGVEVKCSNKNGPCMTPKKLNCGELQPGSRSQSRVVRVSSFMRGITRYRNDWEKR